MSRLTKRNNKGYVGIKGYHGLLTSYCYECTEELEDGIYLLEDALNKLAEYEDLEEQGLLLRLPCKVGDTLYHILTCTTAENFGEKYIDWFIVTHLTVNTTKEMIIMGRDVSNREWGTNSRGIGKTVFLTSEEAEQKLKEMEE